VVVRGLNNPRQLSLANDGSLLVAEAGRGGDMCIPVGNGETCLGTTGAISRVRFPAFKRNTDPVRIVTGLLSGAGRNGASATGSNGVGAGSFGRIYVPMVDAPKAALPPELDASTFGMLLRARAYGTTRIVADVAGYESDHDPDGQGAETNPYAVLVLRDRILIADAGGNDIVQLHNGRLSTFAVLPNIQDGSCAGLPNGNGTTGCDAVPTSLAVDRNGDIYVGAFSTLGNLGTARVFKLGACTGEIEAVYTGLSTVTGVAIGRDGSIFASQLVTAFGPNGPDFTSGKVTRIRPDGTRTDTAVPAPAGLAVAGSHLYVAAWSIAPASGLGLPDTDSSGQVWRLRI
jgi:hypothetical protein